MKKCPFCAEDVQDAAIVCKHCERDLGATRACPFCKTRIPLAAQTCPSCGDDVSSEAATPTATVASALKPNRIAGLFLLVVVGFVVYKMLGGSNDVLFDNARDERKVSGPAMPPATSQSPSSTAIPGESHISRADYGDRWPFTVSEGVLSCVFWERVNFRVGAVTYAVNGMAKGHGNPDVEAIWRTRPAWPPTDVVARVPEAKRREIFRAKVACPEQAERAAEQKFPGASSLSELKTSALYEEQIMTRCIQQVRAKDRLTEKELDLIDAEGYALYWPPATAARAVNIGPIILDGLKLCSR